MSDLTERADPTAVRRQNLGVVLRHVAGRGPISRARIAADTGLNKSTVSSLVAELADLDLVRDDPHAGRVPSVGRPATPVVLTSTTVALGLDISVDGIAACIEDLTGAVRFEAREHLDLRGADVDLVLDRLAALAGDALARGRGDGLRVVGVGVAVPGLVDIEAGALLRAPNLGWTRVAIADELERRLRLDLPVTVENEANLAALAERWDGTAQDLASFIHVTGEVGVGAGIVIGGELFRGSRGFAGELGHVTVDPHGSRCACGAIGCLETLAGIEAVRERAGMARPDGVGELAVAEAIAERAAAGDARTLEAVDEAAGALGLALAGAINLLDLEAVVLGGSFTPLGPWLVPRVRAALVERVLAGGLTAFEVRTSSLGVHAAVRGAAAAHLRRVLDRPWLVAGIADGA